MVTHNIKLLAHYVDDIIIICNSTNINKICIIEDLNNEHKKIKFMLVIKTTLQTI